MRKVHWFIVVVVLIFPIAGFLFYPYMPEQMGTHWSGSDVPDGYMGKFIGTFVIAMASIMAIATSLAVNIGLTIAFAKNRNKQPIMFFDFVIISSSVFLLATYIAVLAWNTGADFNVSKFMFIAVGILTLLMLTVPFYIFTRKSKTPEKALEAKGDYDPSTGEYKDRLVEIRGDTMVFKDYYITSGSKSINLSQVEYVEEKEPTPWNGKYRLHGTGDFRTWFPADYDRADRDKIFVMKIKGKWSKIGFTVENSCAVSELFRTKGLLR